MSRVASPHFKHLKLRWLKRHKRLQSNLWKKHKDSLEWLENSSKQLMVGSLSGLLLLTHPATPSVLAQTLPLSGTQVTEKPSKTAVQLISELIPHLPSVVDPLTEVQEQSIAAVLTNYFNIPVTAMLEGKRLNRSYGYIGAEQHLMRYPGDTLSTHFTTPDEAVYASSGMAPGRGAWGYFATSRAELAQKDVLREKYYIAVQTFLSPGWGENIKEQYEFFKYRKMLVVNPENGKAMVVIIGDAGPAEWTGKHLGGSPEVMAYLERQDGRGKGSVLYFFVDDPEDKIALGPIEIQ